MWHQMLLATSGGARYRECLACRQPFEISKTGRRRQAKFCDDACKARHRREKEEEIDALKAKGWRSERIAGELDMQTSTVRAYLERTRSKRAKV